MYGYAGTMSSTAPYMYRAVYSTVSALVTRIVWAERAAEGVQTVNIRSAITLQLSFKKFSKRFVAVMLHGQ